MIQEYWVPRTFREKIMLGCGAVFLVLFFIYVAIWDPIHSKKETLYSTVQSQQDLLTWMNQQAPILKELRGHGTTNTTSHTQEIFSEIDASFKGHPMYNNLSLTRLSESTASISFHDVIFDDFINQLIMLKKKFNINVDEMQINKLAEPGMVEGKVVLSKSK